MLAIFYFIAYLSVVFAKVTVYNSPIVNTKYGIIEGVWSNSTGGRTYAAFHGIPYAAPPVGQLRFKEPQPPKPWSGIRDGTRLSPICLQYDSWFKKTSGIEDCLLLNVYVPEVAPANPLPVMVYIHGGAFMYGTGSAVNYSPANLMDRNIIVVTLNYRLGALGFLSTGDGVVPGNNGLKDQAFALHWIQENIRDFGGDPASVTLTGNSAGGASVHYHYLSHLSRGTFARGIAFSGSAFEPWTLATKPVRNGRRLATLAGCPTTSSQVMVDCLMNKAGEDIVQAQAQMYDWIIQMFTPFTPTIEPTGTENAFLTQNPLKATKAGDVYKVPLIVSVNSEEGLYPAARYQYYPNVLEDLEARWEQLASNIFEYNDTLPIEKREDVARKIKQRYLAGKPVSQDTFAPLVQALGDRLFNADVGRLVEEHARQALRPTYLYRFSFRGQFSLSNAMAGNNDNYGVAHADDILHIFPNPGLAAPSRDDDEISNILLDLIYSYSTTGTPKVAGVEWLPVSPESPTIDYLEIAAPNKIYMASSPDFGNRTFWDSLGFTENENFVDTIRG